LVVSRLMRALRTPKKEIGYRGLYEARSIPIWVRLGILRGL